MKPRQGVLSRSLGPSLFQQTLALVGRKDVTMPPCSVGKSKGFSLAETVIAIGVVSGIFLVVAALFTQLFRSSQEDEDRVAAALIAQNVMTEKLQTIFANLEPGLTKEQFFSQDTPNFAGTVTLNKSVFHYRITHQTLTTASGNPLGGPASKNNRLKKMNALVWWGVSNPEEARMGSGQMKIEAIKLINENSDYDG